ncbi:putative serine protease PepD [Ruaniaceae bacterium KH17]|nr:putative serine protease PepD [Ruaniaceae bacterium KH17]
MSNSTEPQYPASPQYSQNPWASPMPTSGASPSADPWQGAATHSAPTSGGVPPTYPLAPTAGPFGMPEPSRARTTTATKQRRVWPAVITASLASAALATGGTFAVLNTQGTGVDTSSGGAAGATTVSQLVSTDLESVVNEVADTVVAIDVVSQQGESLGSGVIIDSAGYILTNNHVVSGARQISVTLTDGRIFTAQVVGVDASTDLAVIQLQNAPSDLAVAEIGDSSTVKVGQEVVAVGNPLGLSSTVTTGIVSALDRPVTTTDTTGGDRVVTNAIQVDAAINPGNSGGPLFNADGQVIGVTSSIASMTQSSGSIGLGFAIPSNLASRVANEIIETGSATHAFLGVSMGDTSVQVDGVTRAGAVIGEVVAGSGAADAGLRANDVIVSIDGKTVIGAESLTGYVRQYTPGSQVVLGVVRDGTLTEVTATLGTSD